MVCVGGTGGGAFSVVVVVFCNTTVANSEVFVVVAVAFCNATLANSEFFVVLLKKWSAIKATRPLLLLSFLLSLLSLLLLPLLFVVCFINGSCVHGNTSVITMAPCFRRMTKDF